MPFNKYFQDELAYLREMGREFSQSYPALAPMLADRGGDPDVERLLEGFAFLTGRIREKLDDELPELMLSVAQLMFPQLVRPLPATSVLEFLPLPNALRESKLVRRGTEVQSVPVDGTRCRFRTSADCFLAPLSISRVALQDIPGGRQELQIDLSILQQGDPTRTLPPHLDLHFSGETRDGLTLLAHVVSQASGVTLHDPSQGPSARRVNLPKEQLIARGFDEDEALLPAVATAFPGFRLLQEYYVLPAKFAFLRITDLHRVAELGEPSKLSISIQLEQRITGVRALTTEQLRLHCVPIVNVFETTAEPIRVSRQRERYLVRPAGLPPGQGDVYGIERVQTVARGGERVEIPSFLSFEHAAEMENRSRVFYVEHRRPTVVGEGADTMLSLGTAEDSGVIADAEVLSVDLLATNGQLANALRAGEITEPTPSSPPFAKFRNLAAATTHVPPPLGHDLKWRAMAHTAMNLRALTEPEVLRTTLAVYNLQALIDRQAARANELRVLAIREVNVRPGEKLYQGASVRGVDIDVLLDESGFSGDGDLFLFGAVLERLFAEYVSINSFSRTRVRGSTTNLEYRWPARSGNQTLL
ncbi:MAG TPA: type VI secretion system baseplate subunit TssF [Polyangiaceae bacterium]|nr:type VI secretion system baseplate subunit TssF [Polyangiaceae bacterium]